MADKATIVGTIEGPDATGDYWVHFECRKRGALRVCIDPTSECLTIGKSGPSSPSPVKQAAPASQGGSDSESSGSGYPDGEPSESWTFENFRNFFKAHGIRGYSSNKAKKDLIHIIDNHIANQGAPA